MNLRNCMRGTLKKACTMLEYKWLVGKHPISNHEPVGFLPRISQAAPETWPHSNRYLKIHWKYCICKKNQSLRFRWPRFHQVCRDNEFFAIAIVNNYPHYLHASLGKAKFSSKNIWVLLCESMGDDGARANDGTVWLNTLLGHLLCTVDKEALTDPWNQESTSTIEFPYTIRIECIFLFFPWFIHDSQSIQVRPSTLMYSRCCHPQQCPPVLRSARSNSPYLRDLVRSTPYEGRSNTSKRTGLNET